MLAKQYFIYDDIKDFLSAGDIPVVDVRSPAEYAQGHIPGAINIPLFDDDERAVVGTLYKQNGPYAALLKGLDIAGPKMSGFVKEAMKIAPARKLKVHCWRGGRRSESMAWLLSTSGFQVSVLAGGYKAYRRNIKQTFGNLHSLVVLSGKTGTGKTEILHEMERSGHQILDLEKIACHKGSAFGALGEAPQPTTEQFENNLFHHLQTLDLSKTIWTEDESRFVGKVAIPDELFSKMRSAKVFRVEMPLYLRVKRLLEDYTHFPKDDLIAAVNRIERRLGGQHAKAAVEAIQHDDFAKAIEIVLFYYDKTYNYGLERRDPLTISVLEVNTLDAEENAQRVIEFFNDKIRPD
jgi:tRNA 2-selenouridine synthase